MADRRRGLGTFALSVTLVAAPTLAAFAYYKATGDPTFRPLSVTIERLVLADSERNGAAIVALVDWPDGAMTDAGRAEAEVMIRRAFGSVGPMPVVVQSAESARTAVPRVTYRVGRNLIGPYPLRDAALGVGPAMSAYRMRLSGG